ncbi:uncharacterized protein [Littorina saxatilis]|uniref:uncharacterized protein n=1 Tax=Littorina saxatilis TaxID=31220 RepID=UPI0038B6A192
MFVPHARVHISGVPHKRNSKARQARLARRRVGAREILRMPCLMPTIVVVFIGLLVLAVFEFEFEFLFSDRSSSLLLLLFLIVVFLVPSLLLLLFLIVVFLVPLLLLLLFLIVVFLVPLLLLLLFLIVVFLVPSLLLLLFLIVVFLVPSLLLLLFLIVVFLVPSLLLLLFLIVVFLVPSLLLLLFLVVVFLVPSLLLLLFLIVVFLVPSLLLLLFLIVVFLVPSLLLLLFLIVVFLVPSLLLLLFLIVVFLVPSLLLLLFLIVVFLVPSLLLLAPPSIIIIITIIVIVIITIIIIIIIIIIIVTIIIIIIIIISFTIIIIRFTIIIIIIIRGAGMCVLGYIPDTVTRLSDDGNSTTVAMVTKDARYYATKSLSYAGPVLMGCGFFAIIVSCVLYCEIVDRYAVLMPSKPETRLKRQDLLEMILGEFKKSYFRGIEVPLRKEDPPPQKGGERQMETLLKALSISTPVLLMSPDLAPTWRFSHYPYNFRGHRHHALKPRHPKLKQLGGSGSSGHEPWLKTSSLPNIHDPELRRHNLARPVPLDHDNIGPGGDMGSRARRIKRFGRPSRSMENRISWSLPQTLSRSSTGVDNPAYLHEHDRKKSVSMCVHNSSYSSSLRRPPASRFIKASQLQPRARLQHQQQQQIQKQQQQIQLQQQQEKQKKHEEQKQRQKRLNKQHSSRESDDGEARKRCDSDEVRPRQRPKLVRTKGAHKSFDSSGAELSFATLMPPEPPPFPLPAHFLNTLSPDTQQLTVSSPRTAKLLRAKCKSEDVRDKKKPDIMLLKDLFRSVDMQDPPLPPPSLVSQTSSASMPCTIPPYVDPLTGRQCESVRVTLHASDQDRGRPQPGRGDASAFVRVSPASRAESGSRSRGTVASSSLDRSDGSEPHTGKTDVDSSDQKYELPLLSGVVRSNRQWEVERRKRIITSDSRHEEKSHSLDAKDTRSSKLEAKRSEIHRAHSFNVSFAQESKYAQNKHSTTSKDKDKDKGSSNLLRVIDPHPHKSRSKSWDGDKSQSLDTPTCESSTISTLTVPRIERASSFDPVTSQAPTRDAKQTKQVTSYSSEFVRPVSPYPCRMTYESEAGQKGRSQSDEIRQRTPVVTLPVPLQPQRAHSSPERSIGDSSSVGQHHEQRHAQYHQPSRPQQLAVPTYESRVQEHLHVQSPRRISPARSDSGEDHRQSLSPRHLTPSPTKQVFVRTQSPRHLSPCSPIQSPRHLSPAAAERPLSHDRRQTPSPRHLSPVLTKQTFPPDPRVQLSRPVSPLAMPPHGFPQEYQRHEPSRHFRTEQDPLLRSHSEQGSTSSAHRNFVSTQQTPGSHVVQDGGSRVSVKTMKHSQTEQHLSKPKQQQKHQSQQQQPSQQQPQQQQQRGRGNLKRRSTIVHQASVHLSPDSFLESSASVTSSTASSADNTTSSNVPLLSPSPTPTPQIGCSVAGGVSGGSSDVGGVGGSGVGGSGSGGSKDTTSAHAMRRVRYTQARSTAVEESSVDDEDTEATPLIQNSGTAQCSGNAPKS